jgi:non-homologous end joining protein Ku
VAAEFTPEKHRDTYREQLEKLIAEITSSQSIPATSAPPRTKPVPDIIDTLRKSFAGLRQNSGL